METPLDQPIVGYLYRPTACPAQHRVVGRPAPIDEDVAREYAEGWGEIKMHNRSRERSRVEVPEVRSQPALSEERRHHGVEPKTEEPIVDQTLLTNAFGSRAVPRPMPEAAFSPAEGTGVGLSQSMSKEPLLRPLRANHSRAQSRGVGEGPKRATVP